MIIKNILNKIKFKRKREDIFKEGDAILEDTNLSTKNKVIEICKLLIIFEKENLRTYKLFNISYFSLIIFNTIIAGFTFARDDIFLFILNIFILVFNIKCMKNNDDSILDSKIKINNYQNIIIDCENNKEIDMNYINNIK